jgi:ubiquinone/menaquinone biosynthesis C-methylase UbiE
MVSIHAVGLASLLMATVYDSFMGTMERAGLSAWRQALLAEVSGRVLEVGAGTGVNVPFYPRDVERLVVAEPDANMRKRLAQKVQALGAGAEVSDASALALPWGDGSFDAVVCTLVLCTVPDPARALAEIHRVLVPGGAFVYLEHVAADHHPGRLAWQRRLEPFWSPLAGGCRLTRRTSDTIRDAGFDVAGETRESARKAMPLVRTMVRGIARKPLTSR